MIITEMQCLFKKPALSTIACILISGCRLRPRSVYIVFKLFLQMIQVRVHCGSGFQPYAGADFTHGRGIALFFNLLTDKFKDFVLVLLGCAHAVPPWNICLFPLYHIHGINANACSKETMAIWIFLQRILTDDYNTMNKLSNLSLQRWGYAIITVLYYRSESPANFFAQIGIGCGQAFC